MTTTGLSPTTRSTVRRGKERAQSDRTTLYDVLGDALVCHLSCVVDEAPLVVPTVFGYDRDTLYLHGSTGARSLRAPGPVCVAVTVVDGIVYAKSVFHHSMNYRAAVIHGEARDLVGDEKLRGLEIITEHVAPGSWTHARLPTRKELAQTAVLALDLHEASVKLRCGPPVDEDEDFELPVWAGVLPVHQSFGRPVSDETTTPAHVENRWRRQPGSVEPGCHGDTPSQR